MTTKKTITEVITPWVEEINKAQNALISEEEKMNQIEQEYLKTILSLKEKTTVELLVEKQKLAADLENQSQMVLYHKNALDELIKAADNNELISEIRGLAHNSFITDEMVQSNQKLNTALKAFLEAYDESMNIVSQQVSKYTQEVAPLAEIIGSTNYGSNQLYREVQGSYTLPGLMNELKYSRFHSINISQDGVLPILKRIYKEYGIKEI